MRERGEVHPEGHGRAGVGRNVESRGKAESLMREAAEEFVAINDLASDLDGYLSCWYERLHFLPEASVVIPEHWPKPPT